jgi:hypothetical protein
MRDGGVMVIAPAQTEQGFRIWTAGNWTREIVDHEGLYLARRREVSDPDEPPFQSLARLCDAWHDSCRWLITIHAGVAVGNDV